MRRREFIAVVATAAGWPLSSGIAQTENIPRMGFLGNSTAALEAHLIQAFHDGLRERGHVPGLNIFIEPRWAEGKYERFSALIAELIAEKVVLIVTAGTPASLAVQKATRTIPCVMVAVGDPVGTGLVASLARPGGNMTGLTSIAPELEGKRLGLLREVIPTLGRIAVFWNPVNPFLQTSRKELQAAAQVLGIAVQMLEVKATEDLDAAFAAIVQERPGAILVLADRVFLHNRARIIDFAAQRDSRNVSISRVVDAGGLMSYGPNYPHMHRQAAACVDKILKGADPAELPVERPTTFELVLNLKTAKILASTFHHLWSPAPTR